MPRIGMVELIIIFLVVLLLFGAKKLPEIAQSIGKAIKEFKKAGKDIQSDIKEVAKDEDDQKPS